MEETPKTAALEDFTDTVDLSNACREFYQSRRKVAETVKEKLAASGRQQQKIKTTSMDTAILKLKTEMVSLMDKDLSLMKQLLNLNETIEDLKWQKRNSYIEMPADSSCDLTESDWSVSETDMYESESDVEKLTSKLGSMSFRTKISVTENSEKATESVEIKDHVLPKDSAKSQKNDNLEDIMSVSSSKSSNRLSISLETRKFLGLPAELDEFLNGPSSSSDDENSFDSGIQEAGFWQEVAV